MALRITVSDKVRIKIKGSIAGEDGPEPFDFSLLCKRLDSDQIADELNNAERKIKDFVLSVAEGWQGVKEEDGSPAEFSEKAFAHVLRKYPNMAQLIFSTYLRDCGAMAGN